MTTAAVYIRVSTEDQARHGFSLGGQLEACRARAIALGAKQIVEYADEGVSGALLKRPGLSSLREALRTGAIDLVVVLDPDRLARNLSHQLLITDEIEKARARLEFVNFEWRNTAEGQLFYAVRGAIAQFEKEKIKERTSHGRHQKAKTGKLPLAFKPYGYDYNPETSLLDINETEASIVQDMFRWMLEEGDGPNGVARRLNQMGVPAKKGGVWHRAVVRQILTNPVYTGKFCSNRWNTAGYGLNRHRPKEERVAATLRPKEEWVEIKVPPIVTEEVWNQAQRMLENARRLWAGLPRAEYLLSGLLLCGQCNTTMSGFNAAHWGKKFRSYTCRKSWQGAPAGACNRRVTALPVEQAVWNRLMTWVRDPDELRKEVEQGVDIAVLRKELAEIDEALTQAARGRQNVLSVLERGAVSTESVLASLQRIQERESALHKRQAELKGAMDQTVSDEGLEAWRETARYWLGRIESSDVTEEEKRLLVRSVITRVVVHQGSLTVFAKWPSLFPQVAAARDYARSCNRKRNPDASAQSEACTW